MNPNLAPAAAVAARGVTPVKAVEAYTYGFNAAANDKPAGVPVWFDKAAQSALDKYDAMKAAPAP